MRRIDPGRVRHSGDRRRSIEPDLPLPVFPRTSVRFGYRSSRAVQRRPERGARARNVDLSIRRRLFRCLRVELCSNTSRIRSLISRRLVGSCVHVAYVFRTPNLYHFIPLVSRLAPHRFHQAVANRLRNLPREAPDPYRTYYRLNSRGAIRAPPHAQASTLASSEWWRRSLLTGWHRRSCSLLSCSTSGPSIRANSSLAFASISSECWSGPTIHDGRAQLVCTSASAWARPAP